MREVVMDDHRKLAIEVHELFGRHFVSMAGGFFRLNNHGKSHGKEIGFNFSGFILSIRGRWNLVTAGHILRKLESGLIANQIALNRCYLIDSYGPNPATDLPTPFTFEDAPKIYADQDGLDFGLIGLSDYYTRLLLANGVLPFAEIDWVKQPQQFDAYF